MKPTAHATSSIGYIRLHGRNYQNWFSQHAGVRERYDFLYSMDELEPWGARLKSIAEDAEEPYAVTNNHNLGKSTGNASPGLPLRAAGENAPRLLESPELQQIADEPKAVSPPT